MKKWDHRLIGLSLGIVGPILILYGVNVYQFPHMSFFEFIGNGYNIKMLSTWLKPAVLFNLAIFMLFINLYKNRSAQGVVFATIIYGLLIAYLTFA
ncbi:MAG: hypothetical protein JXR19_03935 [Bacteroidia bacterium]